MRALLAGVGFAFALAAGPAAASDAPIPAAEDGRWTLGGEVSVLGATICAPRDDPGEPTLLAGSAFTGPGVRVGIASDAHVTGLLRLGATFGFAHLRMNGHAERNGMRRDLALGLSALDVGVRARLAGRSGAVRPFGGLGVSGRFGLQATATETRVGFTADEPAPDVKPSAALLLTSELGFSVVRGRFELPIALDVSWNATHGRTTRDRLDGYVNLNLPGTLRVDATWTYGLRVGAAYRF